MALTTQQQIKEQIAKAKHILVAFRVDWHGDAVGSAMAIYHLLKNMGKDVTIASAGFDAKKEEMYKFLPDINTVKSELTSLKKFVVEFSLDGIEIEELSYDVADGKLQVFVTPKKGSLSEKQMTTKASEYRFDLIIVVCVPDLARLGSLFESNSDFFYKTPIINIDHSAHNEQFGQINLVDLPSTSAAEVVFNLIETLGTQYMNETIATCLLTGVIANTRSFSTPNVKPQTLDFASRLIAHGAKREEIIRHLYWKKSLATLKLWGNVLTNIQMENDLKLVWAAITKQQFIQTGSSPDDLEDVIHDLLSTSPEAQMILLAIEGVAGTDILLHSNQPLNALDVTKRFLPTGSRRTARFTLPEKDLRTAIDMVVEEIRSKINQAS